VRTLVNVICGSRRSASGRLPALAVALGLVASVMTARLEAAEITVSVDEAKLVQLPQGTATLVIGNPLIADVSVQSGRLAVITGKGYGITNVVALDLSGVVLAEHLVWVHGPRDDDVIVVYRGIARNTYSCMPQCEPRITLGDSKTYFEDTISHTVARNGQAQGIQPGK
jgi:Pilus formation protein N terminal region